MSKRAAPPSKNKDSAKKAKVDLPELREDQRELTVAEKREIKQLGFPVDDKCYFVATSHTKDNPDREFLCLLVNAEEEETMFRGWMDSLKKYKAWQEQPKKEKKGNNAKLEGRLDMMEMAIQKLKNDVEALASTG